MQPAQDMHMQMFQTFLNTIGAGVPQQKFPKAIMPEHCEKCVDMTRIYDLYYTKDVSLEYVISFMRSMPFIEYAEPNYIHELLYIPNDPEVPSMYHLNTYIYDAWVYIRVTQILLLLWLMPV